MSSGHDSGTLARTEKNCAFVRAVILDVNRDKTMGDHYREVFGSNASGQSLRKMASRVWSAPVMKEYAAEIRADMMERFMVTVESLTEELEEARKAALGAENPQCGAAVAATMGKAKLFGLDKQVIEHTGRNGGPILTKALSDWTDEELARLIEDDEEG